MHHRDTARPLLLDGRFAEVIVEDARSAAALLDERARVEPSPKDRP